MTIQETRLFSRGEIVFASSQTKERAREREEQNKRRFLSGIKAPISRVHHSRFVLNTSEHSYMLQEYTVSITR
jgi:hypothetical protein